MTRAAGFQGEAVGEAATLIGLATTCDRSSPECFDLACRLWRTGV